MKFATLLMLALLSPAHAANDNGSSGIGSAKTPVVDDVWVPLKKNRFKQKGQFIVRLSDESVVLTIEPVSSEEAREKKSLYNQATLGTIRAWEFIPDRELEKDLPNSWLVCGNKNTCAHVSAASDSGFEAAALIGLFSK